MQIIFNMTRPEWREAMQLYRTRDRRSMGGGLVWMCILAPLAGALFDLAYTWRTQSFEWHGSVFPAIAVVICIAAAALYGVRQWNESRSELAGNIPLGDWQIAFREEGLHRIRLAEAEAEIPMPIRYAWAEFRELRIGSRVLVLILINGTGFEALPLRALDAVQLGHLKRMIARKVHPPRPVEESRTGIDQRISADFDR